MFSIYSPIYLSSIHLSVYFFKVSARHFVMVFVYILSFLQLPPIFRTCDSISTIVAILQNDVSLTFSRHVAWGRGFVDAGDGFDGSYPRGAGQFGIGGVRTTDFVEYRFRRSIIFQVLNIVKEKGKKVCADRFIISIALCRSAWWENKRKMSRSLFKMSFFFLANFKTILSFEKWSPTLATHQMLLTR